MLMDWVITLFVGRHLVAPATLNIWAEVSRKPLAGLYWLIILSIWISGSYIFFIIIIIYFYNNKKNIPTILSFKIPKLMEGLLLG